MEIIIIIIADFGNYCVFYDLGRTFQHVCVVLCPERCPEILEFSCPKNILFVPRAECIRDPTPPGKSFFS